jgi:hypothetical protein
MKLGAGVALLSIARLGLRVRGRRRFMELGGLLAICVSVVSATQDPVVFFLGLFGFEIGLNLLSARLQAALASVAPQFAGQWLTGTVLLGAALGPPLNGVALERDFGIYFLAFAVLSAFLPVLWSKVCKIDDRIP